MATKEEIHVGDIGTCIELELIDGDDVLDLTGSTTTKFIFKPPNAPAFERDAVVVNPPGTNGLLDYTTIAGDLGADHEDDAAAGTWRVQARVVLGAGASQQGEWRSERVKFEVFANLVVPSP